MNRIFAFVLLLAGLALILAGMSSFDAPGPIISQILTSSTTSKALWLVIIGFLFSLVGLAGVLRSPGS